MSRFRRPNSRLWNAGSREKREEGTWVPTGPASPYGGGRSPSILTRPRLPCSPAPTCKRIRMRVYEAVEGMGGSRARLFRASEPAYQVSVIRKCSLFPKIRLPRPHLVDFPGRFVDEQPEATGSRL